ncbi:MAG: RsmE family RNA methyltransferase [Candidatus Neomarinimicrobiota bacterium]|nr:RsmE family RNA methyltransferase [Candidatus Neomarinimicrobiota bacterium]MEC9455480.1 RsmE family RNA methyltransferase [Candidatus Neomarinimicrobiota bacterium]MEE3241722.1 RsmE family RNA methyltransferase [Candidatus Neomarinimicrobiota bacterium]
MSNFFFIDKKNIQRNNFCLNHDESHHLINVMRLKVNSKTWLTDGDGTSYSVLINSFDNGVASGEILESYKNKNELNHYIHLGLPIIKNSRIKIAVEKSVECGVKEITPLSLDRSVKSNLSIERLNSISQSAGKQSMRSIFPKINPISSLSDWYSRDAINIVCFIGSNRRLSDFKDEIFKASGKKISVLIGPEGDFSNEEKEFIYDKKFLKVNLGNTILRTETAVISILSVLNELMAQYE